MNLSARGVMVASALAVSSGAVAQNAVQWRVEDGGNGHWYLWKPQGSFPSWTAARDVAFASGGYLASIQSESEEQFARSAAGVWTCGLAAESSTAIGGFQPNPNDVSCCWEWVSGEPWGGWAPWSGGAPDNGPSEPESIVLMRREPGWNDGNIQYGPYWSCRIAALFEWSADCNNDGIVDYGQIRAGELVDTNANNIPDCCEQGFDCRFNAVEWRVADGGNGHWYQVVSTIGQTWEQARVLGASMGGSLVTLSNAQEDVFVRALTPDVTDTGFWIGATRQPNVSCSGSSSWQWIDGTPWAYTAWASNQPDCWVTGQDRIAVVRGSYYPGWHDFGNLATDIARAVIEFSADCNADGIVDYGQIRAGELVDTNANNIPDCCEQGFDCRFNAVEWSVKGGGNGHWYRVVVPQIPPTWDAAKQQAIADGGSLVSLNSLVETTWCYQLSTRTPSAWRPISATTALGPWTGGLQQPGATEPNGGWVWSDGGSVDLAAAKASNNNSSGCGVNEDRLTFWHPSQSQPTAGSTAFETSDFPARGFCEPTVGPISSFIIEYSADCNSDGIVDYGQIRAGELVDANANNIPDCCEQSTSCTPCAADVDESGAVNSIDLAAVLANWGTNGGKYPRADIDGDGTVNSTDLAAVLGAWGPCQ